MMLYLEVTTLLAYSGEREGRGRERERKREREKEREKVREITNHCLRESQLA